MLVVSAASFVVVLVVGVVVSDRAQRRAPSFSARTPPVTPDGDVVVFEGPSRIAQRPLSLLSTAGEGASLSRRAKLSKRRPLHDDDAVVAVRVVVVMIVVVVEATTRRLLLLLAVMMMLLLWRRRKAVTVGG